MALTIKLAFLAVLVASVTGQGLLDFASSILKASDSNPVDAARGIAKVAAKAITDSRVVNASLGAVNVAGKGIKTGIAGIKNPGMRAITHIGSSQCNTFKKLVGLHYDQVQGVAEPDLDQLTLNFISDELELSFKLGEIAASLPQDPSFDPSQPLVIFMHGFVDDPSLYAFSSVNKAFQKRGHYNILALDASPLIRWLYLRSSTFVRFIGEKLGVVLAAMVRAGLDPQDIHLVGHSLGSHISGFAGKTFQDTTGSRVGRITGLDPAGPCFSHIDESLRLIDTDADYVDVIHSNDGVYGLKDAIGHADYFPNGGKMQPNCLLELCSHLRVVELFAESVENLDAFPAQECASWRQFQRGQCSGGVSVMGYASSPTTRGRFYLRTRDERPFGLGEAGLRARGPGLSNTLRDLGGSFTGLFGSRS